MRRALGVRPFFLADQLANRHEQPKLGVDGLGVAHAGSLGPRSGVSTSPPSQRTARASVAAMAKLAGLPARHR